MHPHQFQHAACKLKALARFQPGDEVFFDRTEACAAALPARRPKLHSHAGVAGNGADVEPVAARQPRIRHAPDACFVGLHALVVGVNRQGRAALAHKVQAPLPGVTGQVGKRSGLPHLGIKRVRLKTAAQRHRDEVLHQHIQRLVRRQPLLDLPCLGSRADGSGFHQFQAVGRHQRDARRPARCVARAPSPLQQPRHTFGRADLQHPLHRQKVHPQIQAGRADHRLELAAFQRAFHPFAHRPVERAVVQRQHAGPIRTRFQHRLEPQLCLRAGVGEHQAGAAAVNFSNHLRQHGQAQVAGPGETLGLAGQQGVNDQCFGGGALDQHTVQVTEQRVHRFVQIAQRGGHPPNTQSTRFFCRV